MIRIYTTIRNPLHRKNFTRDSLSRIPQNTRTTRRPYGISRSSVPKKYCIRKYKVNEGRWQIEEFLKQSCEEILKDSACGKVFRIKGFQKFPDGRWISINATHQGTEIHPVESGQEVLIVIGENLNKEAIEQYWGKSK